MNFGKLPNELKYKIIEYLPHDTLKDLYDILPTSSGWKSLLASRLYSHISISNENPMENADAYRISFKELEQLACGEIDAQVQRLDFETYLGTAVFNKYLNMLTRLYSDFIANIPQITFKGYHSYLDKLLPETLRNNMTELTLNIALSTFSTEHDPLPPKLEVLRFWGRESTAKLKLIPKSLRSISVDDVDIDILFPSEFDDHGSFVRDMSKTFPEPLTSLSLTDYYEIRHKTFTDKLTFLCIRDCYFGLSEIVNTTWPRSLKELRLEQLYIENLTGVVFPPSLDILSLEDCGIESFKGAVFPELLQSLDISLNPFKDLDGVIFPNLKKLDFRNQDLVTLSGARFPWTLESLAGTFKGYESNEMDLLQNLRKLSGRVDNENFTFPSQVEELDLVLGEDVNYSKLLFPKTIKNLSLKGGKSSNFDWKLPLLEELRLEDFHGPVQVPDTVTMLMLKSEYHDPDGLTLHEGIRHLVLSCQLTQYPLSLRELEFWDFTSKSLNLDLPNLRKLKIRAISNQVILPSFPPKLRFIDGSFDNATMERFYSLQG